MLAEDKRKDIHMKYDFTSIIDRRGKDAIAVDGVGVMKGFAPEGPKEGFDVIPMWIADMNFPTVPTVQEAIIERAKHPAFGGLTCLAVGMRILCSWKRWRS